MTLIELFDEDSFAQWATAGVSSSSTVYQRVNGSIQRLPTPVQPSVLAKTHFRKLR